MSGHTPGPWFTMGKIPPSRGDHGLRLVAGLSEDWQVYAHMDRHLQPKDGQIDSCALRDRIAANAKLISAAPDLHSVCREVFNLVLRDGWKGLDVCDSNALLVRLATALNKAEG